MQADLDKLKKFKLSGYVQARSEIADEQATRVKVRVNPTRRYAGQHRRGSTSAAGASSSPTTAARSARRCSTSTAAPTAPCRLLEAYVTLLDPWTPLHQHRLTVGPDERAVRLRDRALLQRARAARALARRERAVLGRARPRRQAGQPVDAAVETVVGIFNGGGINSADFPNTDPTRAKDLVARARWSSRACSTSRSPGTRARTSRHSPGPTCDRQDASRRRCPGLLPAPAARRRQPQRRGLRRQRDQPRLGEGLHRHPRRAGRLLKPGAHPGHLATDMHGRLRDVGAEPRRAAPARRPLRLV